MGPLQNLPPPGAEPGSPRSASRLLLESSREATIRLELETALEKGKLEAEHVNANKKARHEEMHAIELQRVGRACAEEVEIYSRKLEVLECEVERLRCEKETMIQVHASQVEGLMVAWRVEEQDMEGRIQRWWQMEAEEKWKETERKAMQEERLREMQSENERDAERARERARERAERLKMKKKSHEERSVYWELGYLTGKLEISGYHLGLGIDSTRKPYSRGRKVDGEGRSVILELLAAALLAAEKTKSHDGSEIGLSAAIKSLKFLLGTCGEGETEPRMGVLWPLMYLEVDQNDPEILQAIHEMGAGDEALWMRVLRTAARVVTKLLQARNKMNTSASSAGVTDTKAGDTKAEETQGREALPDKDAEEDEVLEENVRLQETLQTLLPWSPLLDEPLIEPGLKTYVAIGKSPKRIMDVTELNQSEDATELNENSALREGMELLESFKLAHKLGCPSRAPCESIRPLRGPWPPKTSILIGSILMAYDMANKATVKMLQVLFSWRLMMRRWRLKLQIVELDESTTMGHAMQHVLVEDCGVNKIAGALNRRIWGGSELEASYSDDRIYLGVLLEEREKLLDAATAKHMARKTRGLYKEIQVSRLRSAIRAWRDQWALDSMAGVLRYQQRANQRELDQLRRELLGSSQFTHPK